MKKKENVNYRYVEQILENLIVSKQSFNLKGEPLVATGTISLAEAHTIITLIKKQKFRATLETGVAYGASTLAMCYALSLVSRTEQGQCLHLGVDPGQNKDYGGAAIAALKSAGLDSFFELLEGSSHAMLPKLLLDGVKIDLMFIDGWHTFDYTMIDMFYGDKLLRINGYMIMHDMYMRSKQKAFRWLLSHRHYRVVSLGQDNLLRRFAASLIWLLRGRADVARSRLMGVRGLLVAEKLDDWEPPYDFFSAF